jgi:hypothetical protein
MGNGSQELFEREPRASRYGKQTGETHGGLLYSRTPTQFWHEAPGMLRDVDMSGCYNNVIASMNVYWGRPTILEPGARTTSLAEAVAFAERHAGPDAWLIRATGEITAAPNALIPSTEGALTSRNYHIRERRAVRRAAVRGFGFDRFRDASSPKGTGKSKLNSAVVESGIVTRATWLAIQALPPALRREYEALSADAIILYPRRLVAADGATFDELVARHSSGSLAWKAELDLDTLCLTTAEAIDARFVALRFPIGDAARQIGKFRREAQRVEGKGSGADTAWKVTANSMYGVLACPHLDTCNFVAANQITATARACAFMMVQALNGFQVITDGCTYRRDQIPACTFEECLKIWPDYPIRRAEADSGIPFLDPSMIPSDDEAFTAWYRDHVKRFFGVSTPDHDALFAIHSLVHKKTSISKSVAFDALATDGCGNYLKATRESEGGWQVEDLVARSYGRLSKPLLEDWIPRTYASDRLTEPAPVTEDTTLLTYRKAGQLARKALDSGIPAVVYPLGLEFKKVGAYKAIKPSAFVFKTPEQRKAIEKQVAKFQERSGCGLEVLAQRRGYGGRRQGSLVDIAEEVYGVIQKGGHDLTKPLNLNRKSSQLARIYERRLAEIEMRKEVAQKDLFARIDVRDADPAALATGYIVTPEDRITIEAP